VALGCDTGPILAAMDRSDVAHQRSLELLAAVTEQRVIPAPVMVELDYWFHKHFGRRAIVAFLDDVANGAYVIEELLPQDYERIRANWRSLRGFGHRFRRRFSPGGDRTAG
jgi:uncharacterized protein